MAFIWPVMLILLLAVPLLAMLYVRLLRKRQQAAARFASLGQATPTRQTSLRRHLPAAFFLVSLAILIIAMARPQTVVSLPRVEGTVILAFDVSGSMAADDLKPTRMEAAKVAARDFVERQPINVKIGVMAFSDNGFTVQAPTNERDAILASINRLSAERGTSLANGILASLNMIIVGPAATPALYSNLTPTPAPSPTPMPKGTYTSGVIVLLTDGENNENPDPLEAAQTAADHGVRIYTVGIGSPAGTTLHVNGFTVRTRLDEAMLQQIAKTTDGNYYNAESEQELRKIYDNLNPELALVPEKTEVTSIFTGVGILTLLIGSVVSLLWFGRLP